MIKALIFDFDGTLSNRLANAYDIYYDSLKPYFSDFDEMEYEAMLQDLMYYDCNGSISMSVRMVAFESKYGDHLPKDFIRDYSRFYTSHMYEYTKLQDEAIGVLERLRGQYKLGLLSNGDPFSQHHKIDHTGVGAYFDEVMVSGDLGVHKPDKEIFAMMAERLGVRCDECLMIGDVFSSDILGAYRAGMVPVWVCKDSDKKAKNYKGYRISDLRELYGILENER